MRIAGFFIALIMAAATRHADEPAPAHLLEGHDKAVLSVAYSRDGSRLASGSESGLTRIWDPKTGEPTLDLEFQYSINGIVFTRDGKELVTATWNAQVWDATDGKRTNHLEAHTGFLTCVAISPDGKPIATGGLDSTVKLWDPATWQELKSLPHADQVNALAFSGDGKLLAVAGDTSVTLWDIVTLRPKRSEKGKPATAVALDKDGKVLAVGRADGTIQLFDTADGKELRSGKPHEGRVAGASISPDGKFLATAGADKTARLFSLSDLKERASWKHPEGVTSIAFAPDGKSIATGCRDKCARIWKVPNGQ